MMPLIFAEAGKVNIIKKIGGSPEVKQHLEDMGFNVGGQVSVISTLGGNVIVRVKDARVALDSGLAAKIMI
ncbi:MAG: ferrous iron transport protein A [Clostridia bacterium]|nr:ferrous iron transport protein A [Clostridia bacterium]